MENANMYIQILLNSSKRKIELLDAITLLCEKQENLLKQVPFNEELFNETLLEKDKCISEINNLDDGFETIFSKVQEEIKLHPESYRDQIKQMQSYITDITRISISIQAYEKRNKAMFENALHLKRKEIRSFKASQETVNNYYKNMPNQHIGQSYFMDKKN